MQSVLFMYTKLISKMINGDCLHEVNSSLPVLVFSYDSNGFKMQAFCSHVYIHMFLFCFVVSVAYKCHVERGSRVAVHYWKEYITSVSPLHCIISGVSVCTCMYMYVCSYCSTKLLASFPDPPPPVLF